MQTIDERVYRDLTARARDRGVSVQEFIRAIVIPYYIRNSDGVEQHTNVRRRTR